MGLCCVLLGAKRLQAVVTIAWSAPGFTAGVDSALLHVSHTEDAWSDTGHSRGWPLLCLNLFRAQYT